MEDLIHEFDVNTQPIPFKIFSGILRATRGPDGKMRLHGVASSTVKDRHGDVMERSAIEDMERAANDNLTIFLNHSYNVPEDVAGSVERAAMIERGMDNVGNPIWDLDFDVLVNQKNPRAVDAFGAIEEGTKLGLSIGAMIPEGGARRDKKTGSYAFDHVDLLETSIVGIPANPRSWISNAVKALKASTTMPLGTPTLTLDGDHYKIEGTLDSTTLSISSSTILETEDTDLSGDPPDDICGSEREGVLCTNDPGHEGGHSWDDSGEPQGTAEGVEPDVTDAKIQVITIDTDDPQGAPADSQEAPGSDPDTESDDDVYDSAEPTDALTATLTGSLDTLEATAAMLVEVTRQRDEAYEERDAARRERDEVSAVALGLIGQTSQIIDKLAAMPVGRKATIRDAHDELSGLERIYGPEILKLIRSNETNG